MSGQHAPRPVVEADAPTEPKVDTGLTYADLVILRAMASLANRVLEHRAANLDQQAADALHAIRRSSATLARLDTAIDTYKTALDALTTAATG